MEYQKVKSRHPLSRSRCGRDENGSKQFSATERVEVNFSRVMRRYAAVAALSFGLAAVGCGGNEASEGKSGGGPKASGTASKEPYRIGAAVDITGSFSATSAPKLEGLQLYANWLN